MAHNAASQDRTELNGSNNTATDGTNQKAPIGNDQGVVEGGKKVKSAKEQKERVKAEKAKKFAEKQAKLATAQSLTQSSKTSEKKNKAKNEEQLPEYVEETPKGQKKILKPLDDAYHKAYIPKVVESAWYDWWEKEGFFQPEFGPDNKVKKEGYFVIPEPPPNVTGALHCGHALGTALQDALIRWNRMRGLTTLWVPGCDHAGISTQSVVEKMLWRREKKTRYDLGRPKFTETVWDWKDEYHQKINTVLKRLGGSFDWTREAFTMDSNLSAAVTETFVRMHEEGYIYRSNRLVNWCVKLNTALSNLEVDNKDLEGRTLLDVPGYDRKVEFGILVHFKYPVDGSEDTIEVATTRPETMLGDTGIAVHPQDKRYQHLIGKKARHPFVDRLLPIFGDEYVDPEFGTGAVKITPAHDPNDFNLGTQHKLDFINILNDDGTMNKNAGSFEGQKRFDVRYSVVDRLTERGLFVKKENNPMKVPLCNKTKDVIEPVMKPQWWMKMRLLADNAIKVVQNGEIQIKPESAKKSYLRWLENINDWCLSRQLWWGHQAPAYLIRLEGKEIDSTKDDFWVTGRTEQEAHEKALKKFPDMSFKLERDPDVLDTWFSSALWPFSTLGWPKQTHDLENLYPTSLLETAWDILFFWVARMVMFGLKLTGKVPFKEVYCHSLIRDAEGRKMSKSLGNVIDPIDIMQGISLQALNDKLLVGNLDPKELKTATKYQQTAFPQGIPECGADALRFSLVQYTTGGGDIAFDVKVMQGYRRFCNKVYQATKYVLGKIDKDFVPQASSSKTGKESLAERWILHKFTIAARDINKALTDREFSKSTQIAYQYFYENLCDVYIENSKAIIADGTPEEARSAQDTLYTALEGGLTLLHPFMPFLTEELWQRLPRRPVDKTPSIVVAKYPQYDASLVDSDAEASYELLIGCSKGIRSLMAEYAIKEDGKALVHARTETACTSLQNSQASLSALCGRALSSLTILPPASMTSATSPPTTGYAVFAVSATASVYVDVRQRITSVEAEINKAKNKLAKAKESVTRQRKILDAVAEADVDVDANAEGKAESKGKNQSQGEADGKKEKESNSNNNNNNNKQKVSEAVKEMEAQRLRDAEAEARSYEITVRQFEGLLLEEEKEKEEGKKG